MGCVQQRVIAAQSYTTRDDVSQEFYHKNQSKSGIRFVNLKFSAIQVQISAEAVMLLTTGAFCFVFFVENLDLPTLDILKYHISTGKDGNVCQVVSSDTTTFPTRFGTLCKTDKTRIANYVYLQQF